MRPRLTGILTILSFISYLITHLLFLQDFPIYFFCDEAYIGNKIHELIAHNFSDASGRFLPLYYEKAPQRWVPQISLYLYLPFVMMFGNGIAALRAGTVILSIPGLFAMSRLATDALRLKEPWLVVAILGSLPVWFLHVRTVFETALIIPFLAMYLWQVTRWLNSDRGAVLGAPITGALLFYSHFSGSIAFVATSLSIVLLNPILIGRQWRRAVTSGGILLVLMIPFLIFSQRSPGAMAEQLFVINSHWYVPGLSTAERVRLAVMSYLNSFSISYWFSPEGGRQYDAVRHLWGGRGYVGYWVLPLVVSGIGISVWRWQDRNYRILLGCLMASTAASLIVPVMIMRVFAVLVPVSLLVAVSIDVTANLISSTALRSATVSILGVGFAFFQGNLLREAITKGPTWFSDYGLYGMAWGTKELYQSFLPHLLSHHPDASLLLTSSWANGADSFNEFFVRDATSPLHQRLSLVNVEDFNATLRPGISERAIIVLTEEEWKKFRLNPKFFLSEPIEVLNLPDGRPGFFAAHFGYSPEAQGIFERELAERRKPITTRLQLGSLGGAVITHSQFDIGSVADIFDDSDFSLVRTPANVNPLILQIVLDTPTPVTRIKARLWPMTVDWNITISDSDGVECFRQKGREQNTGEDATIEIEPSPCQTAKMVSLSFGEAGYHHESRVHVKTVTLERRS